MPPVGFEPTISVGERPCRSPASRMGAPYIYDISRLRVKGHLRVQDSFDAPVQLPSFSPVEEVIYFTALCVTATPPAEEIPGVIGKSEAEIPCQDCLPTCERRVGKFPNQTRRHGHLQLHITKSKFLSITKFNNLLSRSFLPTQKKTLQVSEAFLLTIKMNRQDRWLSERES